MKKFSNFMRHFQLINCKIVVYACKELKCLLRGESLEPSFNPEIIHEYMEDLKDGNVKSLPMGAYEYSSCVECLKMIRRQLLKNRKDFEVLTLIFNDIDYYGMLKTPVEDCLIMVAKEVGYEVIDEKIGSTQDEYTLKSIL